jgi:coenzyme F420 hydrogenase subunit beta
MDLALREGFAHAAILTERRANLLPEGRIVRDPGEILTLAGSGYVAGPTLEAFNTGSFEKEECIALVGLPCQVTALTKMRVSKMDRRPPVDQVVMVIGLFCTWALSYGPFIHYLNNRVGDARVRKMDITPPPERLVNVTTDSETFHIPVDEIRPFIRSGCGVCVDMTAELADLSVGMVEGRPGWNTIIVRTQAGEDLFVRAEEKGILETGPLHEGYLIHLREASRLKKLRAFNALKERGDADGGYLRMEDQMRRRIMSCPEKASK